MKDQSNEAKGYFECCKNRIRGGKVYPTILMCGTRTITNSRDLEDCYKSRMSNIELQDQKTTELFM